MSSMMHKSCLFLLLVTQSFLSDAQIHPDSTNFRAPVDIPMYLAGNFGEIRANHFHAGLDIKTQGREGHSVRAVEEGFVSRIKIALGGYGKVVYIDHPNGYTSVYAHLQSFDDKINSYLRKKQYEQEEFLVELFPENGEIQVKKGELIALSGNTGGSGGPHLHFELRETESEFPVNPLLFGFNIRDSIAPRLLRIGVYPLNEVSGVNSKSSPLYLSLRRVGTKYVLEDAQVVKLKGKIGFGIEARDYLNGSSNRNGIYSIELEKDGKSVFQHEMRSFSFDESICINSHVDYPYWQQSGKRVQRCYRQQGNTLSTYKHSINDGQLFFLDSLPHQIRFRVKDSYGNESEATIEVQSDQEMLISSPSPKAIALTWQSVNELEIEGFCMKIDSLGLFEDARTSLDSRPAIGRAQSPIYSIDAGLALAKYAHVFIDVPNVKAGYEDKYFLARLSSNMSFKGGITGELIDGTFSADIKKTGNYTLMIDSVGPSIQKLSDGNSPQGKSIRFLMKDKLNGLEGWRVEVHGKWVLSECDRKSSLLSLAYIELNALNRERKLRVWAADEVGNETEVSFSLNY